MESEQYQGFPALCRYHEIVANFLSETKKQQSEKDFNYVRCSEDIEDLRNRIPSLSEMDQSVLLQDDILSCSNPFQLLLYLALNTQWILLENVRTDDLTNTSNYPKFQSNLKLFSSQIFYEMMTNLELKEEIRSLIRTLAIYFYIRVPGACKLSMEVIFLNIEKLPPVRIGQSVNSECLDFYRSLTSSSVVSDAFSMVDQNVTLDDLFSRVSNYSYYAFFPAELYGLTTIGDIVFATYSFNIGDCLGMAATIITLLHESAHLMHRYRRDQSSYLVLTPKSCKQTGAEYNSEMGDFVEKMIFGERMELINISSADFLLDRNNWNLSTEEFQTRLKSKYKEGKHKGQADTKVGKGNSGYIHRGRCGMAINV
ncbi:unnamed protein product [Blepharisma stoltei]|uniref:Uncharacterized protein n=1 Tax=Blepharisma stoltei TaxID=1481888 RepID=A0AAU9K719_9CILI|nr:unnamed protein product [Blepharisma stoltei]